MADVVIENPILNSPFEEPKRHFWFEQECDASKVPEAWTDRAVSAAPWCNRLTFMLTGGIRERSLRSTGPEKDTKPQLQDKRDQALVRRTDCDVNIPWLVGFLNDVRTPKLTAKFTEDSRSSIITQDVATLTANAPVAGSSSTHTQDDLKGRWMKEVAFLLARFVLEKCFRQ